MQVSKAAAEAFEKTLREELFESWAESFEAMQVCKIQKDSISDFIQYLQEVYEGINDDAKKRLRGALFSRGTTVNNFVDFKACKKDSSSFGYGMIAFGYSPDGQEVDCKIILYKMNFKKAVKLEIKEHSKLFGFMKWTTTEETSYDLEGDQIKAFQNYFRLKALQGFYNEGFIDSINYVSSIEGV